MADTQSSFPVNPSFSPVTKETGYQPYTITISVTGDYILGFGVVDVDKTGGGNAAGNSALLVDNIKLTNIAKVPEPDPIFGLLLTQGNRTSFCIKRNRQR